MAFVPRFNWKRSVGLAKPIRAKSAVAFEPQGGDLTKPRPKDRRSRWRAKGLGQRNAHQPLSPERATYPIPQTNLHHGGTEAQRKTGGCSAPQAARTDGRAPLLIQEGDGAFARGVQW